MLYAIPVYAYVEVSSPQEAAAMKAKLDGMLKNPLIAGAMAQAQITSKGFNVMDPVHVPG